MLRLDLTRLVQSAVDSLVASGRLPAGLPPVELQDTKDPAHGDFATNFAMVASKTAGMNPRALAEMLVSELPLALRERGLGGEGALAGVDIAGPGFINLRLNPQFVASYVPVVAQATVADFVAGRVASPSPQVGERGLGGEGLRSATEAEPPLTPAHEPSPTLSPTGGEGASSIARIGPNHINVEFVSVNPNGPITIGSGRGAAFGSTLANVLEAAGNTVHREYYINDGVNSEQMRLFAESVRFFWMEVLRERLPHIVPYDFPVGGYRGDYVEELGREFALETRDDDIDDWDDEWIGWWQTESQSKMLARQRTDLAAFGTTFDTWFSEQSLHDSGVVEKEIAALVAKGAADDRPIRHKLKLAKGGVVEDVEVEEQTGEEDPESPSPPEGEKGWDEGRPVSDSLSPSPPDPLSPAGGEGESTLWLRSTKFGDDMDRVLRRRDGRLTYIASDIAYHKDKLARTKRMALTPVAQASSLGPDADLHPRSSQAGSLGYGEPEAKLITVLGPDHHGYIGRLHAVMAAVELGSPSLSQRSEDGEGAGGRGTPLTDVESKLYASSEERDACKTALDKARNELDVVIFQLVRFMKDGKPAPMRKRDGNIYALIDLIDEIGKKVKPGAPLEEQRKSGKDVARFFYLMRSHDTTFDFDLDLAEKQSEDNPVFYVQYAHARICSVLRKAEATLTPQPPLPSGKGEGEFRLLTHPKETSLIKKILDLPYEVARCAEDYGVHRLTTYAIELARAYHHFYDACRVILPEDPALSQARLQLCEATKIALQGTFKLLGIEAPEAM